ncbi:hypothetical protein BIY24_11720 [Halobacteriovorax marinus]|uniref:RDD family protein n=1 Tax=Halobacteriovorax marinus TaxID=97084 RepID=UPI000BC312DA|nr:RDD family protein [Halobacteriovorax marinus]ATH08589.1 hypothetical protein BIY24_11720 [Halobacteriovorax marinus]
MTEIANLNRRFEALLIDVGISSSIYICIVNIINRVDIYSVYSFYVRYFILGNIFVISWWMYQSVSFLIIGESLGKSLRRIKVAKMTEDQNYGLKDVFLREFLFRFLDYYLLGYLWCYFNSKRLCFHDVMTDTIVVENDNPKEYSYKIHVSLYVSIVIITYFFSKNVFIPTSTGQFPITSIKGSSFIQDAYSANEFNDELVKKFKNVSSNELSDQKYLRKRILNDYRDFAYLPDRYTLSDENLRLYITISNGQINYASNSMLNDQKYLLWNLEFLSDKNDRNTKYLKLSNKVEYLKYKNKIENNHKLNIKESLSTIKKLESFVSNNPEKLKYIPVEYFNDLIFSTIAKRSADNLLLLSEEVKNSQIFKDFIINNDLNDNLEVLKDTASLKKIAKKKKKEVNRFKKKVLLLSSNPRDYIKLNNLKFNKQWYEDRSFSNFILKHIPTHVAKLPDFANFDKALARKALKESFNKTVRPGIIRGPILNDPYNHLLCFTKDPTTISILKDDTKIDHSLMRKILSVNLGATKEILKININDSKIRDLVLELWSYNSRGVQGVGQSLINLIPKDLYSNEKFIMKVLKKDPVSIYFLPRDISLQLTDLEKNDFKNKAKEQFIYELQNYSEISFLVKRIILFNDDQSVANAIIENKERSYLFSKLSERIRFNKENSIKALKTNIENYHSISPELRSKKENTLKYAVYSQHMYAPFLKNPFFKDRDFVIEYLSLLSQTGTFIHSFKMTYIDKTLQNDPVIKEFIKSNLRHVKYLQL